MLFEKATRLKLRFSTPQGDLSVEDLWDLPLTSASASRANLNSIAKAVSRKLKDEGDEDFVTPQPKANEVLQLKLEIVKHVIHAKQQEREEADAAVAKREQKERLLELIQRKQDQVLEGKSLEELTAMVNSI